MKTIIISFTLKGQSFELIEPIMETISRNLSFTTSKDNVLLVHGFVPRKELTKRGFDTNVVDALEKYFPIQANFYNQYPLRDEMAIVGKKLDATVFVIGEIKEGVAEEVELYKKHGLQIEHMPFVTA